MIRRRAQRIPLIKADQNDHIRPPRSVVPPPHDAQDQTALLKGFEAVAHLPLGAPTVCPQGRLRRKADTELIRVVCQRDQEESLDGIIDPRNPIRPADRLDTHDDHSHAPERALDAHLPIFRSRRAARAGKAPSARNFTTRRRFAPALPAHDLSRAAAQRITAALRPLAMP